MRLSYPHFSSLDTLTDVSKKQSKFVTDFRGTPILQINVFSMKGVADVLHLCTSTIDYMSSFYCTQVWPLPCLVTKSLIDSSFWIQYIDFSMFVDRFVIIVLWISLSCYLDLSKLPHGFVKITWVCQSCSNKTKLKFDQDFIVCWSFCFELKVLNELKYSMPWVCCALSNV